MLRRIHCICFIIQCPYPQDFHAPHGVGLSPFRKADNTELSEIRSSHQLLGTTTKKKIAGNTLSFLYKNIYPLGVGWEMGVGH